MIPYEYFTDGCKNETWSKEEYQVLHILQKEYEETELKFKNRFKAEKDIDEFDLLMKKINEIAGSWAEVIGARKELRKMVFLAKGNLLLRKGQSQAEFFLDPSESYKRAVVLLEQAFEPERYNRFDLMIRLNLGKYFRNIKIHGRRSDYWRAKDEFEAVKDAIEKRERGDGQLSLWETYLWLEAMVNTGRSEKYLYRMEVAKACFWNMLQLLSAMEKIPPMRSGLERSKLLRDAWTGLAAVDMGILLKLDEGLREDYLKQSLIQLGIVYQKCREYEAARTLFEIMLAYEPDNVDAQNNMGVCLRKTGARADLEKAKGQFEKLENNRFAKINLFKCKLDLGEEEENHRQDKNIGELLEEKLKINPEDQELQLLLGRYCQKHSKWDGFHGNQEEWDKSQEIFRNLYEKFPYIRKGTIGLKAYYNIAQDSIVKRKFHQACKELNRILEECVEIEPDGEPGKTPEKGQSVDVLSEIDLGWCLINLGEYDKAKELYEMILHEYGNKNNRMRSYNSSRIKNNLGECYLHLGEVQQALKIFNEVFADEPQNSSTNCFLAQCNILLSKLHDRREEWGESREKLEIARRKFAEAAEAEPDNIYINSGWLLARVMLLEKGFWQDEGLISSIEKSLKYSSGVFSIRACCRFAAFIEKKRDVLRAGSEDMNTLYRALARVRLGEGEEGYSTFQHFQNNDSFRRLEATLRGRILMKLFRVYENVAGIKESCRCSLRGDRRTRIPTHYTKISTLKILLENNPEKQPRLRLWNTVYMNDSFEGDAFIEMLEELSGDPMKAKAVLSEYFHHMNNSCEGMAPINGNVYVTSFSKLEDSIHMWNTYGDDAKGCAVTFADDFFDIRDEEDNLTGVSVYSDWDYPLYEIQYIDDREFKRVAGEDLPEGRADVDLKRQQEHLGAIWTQLCRIEELFGEQDKIYGESKVVPGMYRLWENAKNECRNFVTDCLNEIRFLFKNIEYEHEKELRMIQYSHQPEIDEKNFDVPRLFIEVEREIHMKNVRLGKKIGRHEANGIVSWLYATGKVEGVKESERHYQ